MPSHDLGSQACELISEAVPSCDTGPVGHWRFVTNELAGRSREMGGHRARKRPVDLEEAR